VWIAIFGLKEKIALVWRSKITFCGGKGGKRGALVVIRRENTGLAI
jgi:hypothetical protein